MVVSSFDVFDTCLIRKCGTPAVFFDILSKRVFSEPVPEPDRQSFVAHRRWAEHQSTSNNPCSDIHDIYQSFNWTHPFLLSPEKLANIECDLEREMLCPVLDVLGLIEELREKGHRIIFISDMYLPSTFIKDILCHYGFFRNGDTLFVSCESGLSKRDGSLFQKIQKELSIVPKNWCHHGDNDISDILVPQKLGIRAKKINHRYSYYSQKWIDQSPAASFNYCGLISGLSRAVKYSNQRNPRTDFILDIIAPLYCSFVYWVLNDAVKQGIKRIFFCARDTSQMFSIAKEMSPWFPELEVKYLLVSRTSLYEEDPEIVVQYFKQEGLCSNHEDVALVDTSSSGQTLFVINDILDNYGYSPAREYTIFNEDALKRNVTIDNQRLKYFVRDDYVSYNPIYENLFYFLSVIENVFSMNDDPRTIGYEKEEDKMVPLFDSVSRDQDSIIADSVGKKLIQNSALIKYAKFFMQTGAFDFAESILLNISIPAVADFFAFPRKEYCVALVGCSGYSPKKRMFIPYVEKQSLVKLFIKRGRGTWWPRATVVLSLPEWISFFFIRNLKSKTFSPSFGY